MSLVIADIVKVLERRGGERYGSERVSQLQHALQCATLAERAGASPPLVAAALLHDFGHLVVEREMRKGGDDIHQYVALSLLRGLLPEASLEPIRLHVEAKRYLCSVDPEYWGLLSEASKISLEVQGGVLSPAEAQAFARRPFAADAVRLRKWDDRAKEPGAVTPPLAHFASVLERFTSLHAEP
jgi:phosphonate degradation associated HDIG domain protein